MKQYRLYKYISLAPPWIIMLYLYTKNADVISEVHVLMVTLVFSLLSLLFYCIVFRIMRLKSYPLNADTALVCASQTALLAVMLWVLVLAILPLYKALVSAALIKPIRYGVCALVSAGGLGAVFMLGKKVRRKELFILFAVFETVLLAINGIHAVLLFTQNRDRGAPLTDHAFVVDAERPSPNIYWLFMDGMLGFEGMERLFGDSQDAFTEALAGQGFLINRKAEFEVFHYTGRATAALMCPSWYDGEFLPILRTMNLDDYHDKEKKLGKLNPLAARRNNELIRAFRAKGYTVNSISGIGLYLQSTIHETADTLFYENYLARNINRMYFTSYAQFLMLDSLLGTTMAPWAPLTPIIARASMSIFVKVLNGENVPQRISDKTLIFGGTYDGSDQWYVDALVKTFTEAEPRLTIIHDQKAHVPFIRNEDGSLQARSETAGVDPANYPPQHRYTAKIILAYISLILEDEPDAVIVVQADHGLHDEESRNTLLKKGGTEEDVRVMQNQVMSAVRIPEKWGGLREPLDPLDISRVLVNRYVGQNYNMVTAHP
jgi:hypothetical protein